MKKLKCINPKNYRLTQNGEYEVVEDGVEFVKIINDSGKTVRYSKELFQEEVVPVAPPPPPARTEQDCINSIIISGDNIQFNDLNNDIVIINATMTRNSNNNFSCGVVRLESINRLMERIENRIDTSEDDLIDLKKAILKKAVDWNLRVSPYAFGLISTNQNSDYEDYYDVLDEMSSSMTEWVTNPNSSNLIKIWTLTV